MASFLLAAMAAASLAVRPAAADTCSTIVETAIATPELSTLVDAVTAADLVAALSAPDAEFTVLAPTSDAFAAVGTVEELTADLDALSEILLHHVIEGRVFAADLVDGMTVPTVGGMVLTVGVSAAGVTFTAPNGGTTATVLIADVEACNSVVHVIDTVLLAGDEMTEMTETEDAMPEMTETGMYGGYGDEEAGMYGYGSTDAEDSTTTDREMTDDDADAEDASDDSGADDSDMAAPASGEDTSSASVIVIGAVAAAVVAGLAGVAAIAVRRRQIAASSASSGLPVSVNSEVLV